MPRDVNKLVLWPFPRFSFNLNQSLSGRRNGGKVDNAEKGNHCFCCGGWAAKGKGDSSHRCSCARCLGLRGFQGDRWSEKLTTFTGARIQGRWGRSRRGRHSTSCLQKVPQPFYFQAIFFIHTSKQLHCSNLFKNVWITKIDWVLFILRPKNQGPGILK